MLVLVPYYISVACVFYYDLRAKLIFCTLGSDTFINAMLRPYVELFSSKPPDWQTLLRYKQCISVPHPEDP